jgi:hypothetical protein
MIEKFALSHAKIGIVTKHGKESVIKPIFEQNPTLDIQHIYFDTDTLGTFSGEIARTLSPLEAVRQKCLWALENSSVRMAIATEGSFGPHPYLLGLPLHVELVMLRDSHTQKEWVEHLQTIETNFHADTLLAVNDLVNFAERINFGINGILLSAHKTGPTFLKDAKTMTELIHQFNEIKKEHKSVYAQTDMRAHRNEKRMEKIQLLANRLNTRLGTPCPSCHNAGFKMTRITKGAPCSACNRSTDLPLFEIHSCQFCSYSAQIPSSQFEMQVDPQFCNYCNP